VKGNKEKKLQSKGYHRVYIALDSYSKVVTTRIEGCYSPERMKVMEDLKRKEQGKHEIEPSEFKVFDNRIDYKVQKKMEFDGRIFNDYSVFRYQY